MELERFLLTYEPQVRLAFFLGVFAAVALWETLRPRRPRSVSRWRRWSSNLGIVIVNSLLLRLIFPAAAVGFAFFAERNGLGLFNQVAAPKWLAAALSFLLLDFAIYAQHVAFHKVPLFWRLHRMHHADLDFDVTTGTRFHPVEILLSMLIKFAVVVALGAPPVAVLLFEVALNATSMFSHGNASLPARLEPFVRALFVTPDMHRVHHSIDRRETDSNYGFNFSWWDRLCGTYRRDVVGGQDAMSIGLKQFRDPGELRLDRMLLQPLRES